MKLRIFFRKKYINTVLQSSNLKVETLKVCYKNFDAKSLLHTQVQKPPSQTFMLPEFQQAKKSSSVFVYSVQQAWILAEISALIYCNIKIVSHT
jgi:hypothetical protein